MMVFLKSCGLRVLRVNVWQKQNTKMKTNESKVGKIEIEILLGMERGGE